MFLIMYELNFMHFITGVWSPFSFFLFSFSLLLIGSLFLFSPTCLSNYTPSTYQPAPAEPHQQKNIWAHIRIIIIIVIMNMIN